MFLFKIITTMKMSRFSL